MNYKIKRNYNSKGPRSRFYYNVADFHLNRPTLKLKQENIIDGHPLIFIEIGAAQ